jgi:hypothetical protein
MIATTFTKMMLNGSTSIPISIPPTPGIDIQATVSSIDVPSSRLGMSIRAIRTLRKGKKMATLSLILPLIFAAGMTRRAPMKGRIQISQGIRFIMQHLRRERKYSLYLIL